MHKEVDFIAEYNEEMKELLAEPQTSPSEREWQRFRLSMELVNAQESQYTRVKNEERWKRLEQEFYPALCVIAKTQGGRVELNIKEDTLIGQLVYIGEGLKLERLENRKKYLEKGERTKRTHRLCNLGGTIESLAPEVKDLTRTEMTELMEHIFSLSEVQRAVRHMAITHTNQANREKELKADGTISSERHAD